LGHCCGGKQNKGGNWPRNFDPVRLPGSTGGGFAKAPCPKGKGRGGVEIPQGTDLYGRESLSEPLNNGWLAGKKGKEGRKDSRGQESP